MDSAGIKRTIAPLDVSNLPAQIASGFTCMFYYLPFYSFPCYYFNTPKQPETVFINTAGFSFFSTSRTISSSFLKSGSQMCQMCAMLPPCVTSLTHRFHRPLFFLSSTIPRLVNTGLFLTEVLDTVFADSHC